MNYFYQKIWLIIILFGLSLYCLESLAKTQPCQDSTIIGIVDTGVDLNHDSIKPWLWTNPGETGIDSQGRDKATNGIDDDGNGFADDLHGWNFVKNNADVSDYHGHGTHISGLITKYWSQYVSENECQPFQIMILKYFDQRFPGSDTLENSIKAFRYALKSKVKIINFSGGGSTKSKPEEVLIKLAAKKHVLLVAAAGNESSNSDLYKYYPASYNLPNILSVAALDLKNHLLASSNFGPKTIKLAAPGEDILSTMPGNSYGLMSGSSQATAITTGIAALVMHKKPWLSEPKKMIKYLCSTGKTNKNLYKKIANLKQVSLDNALSDQAITSF